NASCTSSLYSRRPTKQHRLVANAARLVSSVGHILRAERRVVRVRCRGGSRDELHLPCTPPRPRFFGVIFAFGAYRFVAAAVSAMFHRRGRGAACMRLLLGERTEQSRSANDENDVEHRQDL